MPHPALEQPGIYTIACRPALPKDTVDVIELTRHIWEGEDYVPFVWADWLADPQGLLAVAEYGGRVVGLNKLTHLGDGEWWMEGLRVHPDYGGRHIASHLHDYLLGYWKRTAGGVLRLITASYRLAVQHLCQRTGFHKAGEYSSFEAGSLPGQNSRWTPVRLEEANQAFAFARDSASIALCGNLMDLGWQFASPSAERIEQAASQGKAWWWRERQGLLILQQDDEDTKNASFSLLACPVDEMGDVLKDFRGLAGSLGAERAAWLAPLQTQVISSLGSAGFERVWEDSVYLYEKRENIV
ncbi:MAG: GNAT family N-acetyltransferase [Omnitrophica WOR_2 bacterium]